MNTTPRGEPARARAALLELHGAAFARAGFAVVWTDGLEGDAARRVTTKGWQNTKPLPAADGGHFAAGLFKTRGETRNPALVCRASRLIVVESGTVEGLAQVEALGLPATWTVRSSLAHRQHRYFRWPAGVDPEKVAFLFEASGVTGALDHYFLVPPAINRLGTFYVFLPGLSPDDVPIVELPVESYLELLHLAGVLDRTDTPASPPPIVLPPLPVTPEQLRREKLERLLAAGSIEEAERIAADPLGGGHSPFAYGRRVLATAVERVLEAKKGTRHTVLNKSAYIVGGFLAATGARPCRRRRGARGRCPRGRARDCRRPGAVDPRHRAWALRRS